VGEYFSGLRERGQKIPSRPLRPRQADFERIAESARVPLAWLKSAGPNGGYARLAEARRSIGLAEWKALGPDELLSAPRIGI